MAISLSTSAFNQLLRAQVQNGALRTELTELDLGSGPIPITAGFLKIFFPAFAALPPATPLVIRLSPTMAPIVTGQLGPAGEMGEVRISHLLAEVVEDAGLPGETVHLAVAVDARLGLVLGFGPGGVSISLTPPAPGDMTIALISNPLQISETQLQNLLPTVLGSFLPELAGALGTFPLPEFLGLNLQGVEVSRSGQYYSIFANLVATP
jgi:hypothetical protein